MSEEIMRAKKQNDDSTVVAMPRKQFVINLNTQVTEDNIELIVRRAISSDMPCLAALKLDKKSESDPVKAGALLKKILENECIFNGVPLKYLMEGGIRMASNSLKVVYWGPTAINLYNYLASQAEIVTVKGIKIKYIINNLKLVVALQKIYEKLSAYQRLEMNSGLLKLLNNDPEYKEIVEQCKDASLHAHQRFIKIEKELVEGIDCYRLQPEQRFLLCVAGSYDICGAIGQLIFNDDTVFDFKYELDPSSTALVTSSGTSAYTKSPLGFIRTKFMRHAAQAYYSTRLAAMPTIKDEEDLDYIVNREIHNIDTLEKEDFQQDLDDREKYVSEKAEKRKAEHKALSKVMEPITNSIIEKE